LPADLKLDAVTGTISGTPTVPSSKTIYTFTVTDSSDPPATAAVKLPLEIKSNDQKNNASLIPYLRSFMHLHFHFGANSVATGALTARSGSPPSASAAGEGPTPFVGLPDLMEFSETSLMSSDRSARVMPWVSEVTFANRSLRSLRH
jgi:hypothetical protein